MVDLGIAGERLIGETEIVVAELIGENTESYHEVPIYHEEADAGTVKFITFFVSFDKVEVEKRQEFLEEKERELRIREKEILDEKSKFKSRVVKRKGEDSVPGEGKKINDPSADNNELPKPPSHIPSPSEILSPPLENKSNLLEPTPEGPGILPREDKNPEIQPIPVPKPLEVVIKSKDESPK